MGNDNNTIYDFDVNLICEYFLELERQGPGSPEITAKALNFINDLTNESIIADIGCGTGGQTMVIAQNTKAKVIGIDIFQAFIERLNLTASKYNLQDRVKGMVGDMEHLPFQDEELDLIWSEGAIYNIGFEKGINEWRRFIKKDGYIAITEALWFTEKRPAEIEKFWIDAYPEIDTISNKVHQMQKAGYIPIATFILPENCWIENFYIPQVARQEEFLKKYKGNKTVENFIAHERLEAQLYYKYKKYYGYVFYIGKKI